MINHPTTKEHGYLGPQIHQQNPSFGLPKRTSRVFGRRTSLSSDSSRLSNPLSLDTNTPRPSTGLKENPSPSSANYPWIGKQQPLSPTHPVASILNNMSASPMNRGRVDSHPTWKRDESSLRLNGHIGGSIAILSHARSSVDPDSKKNIASGQSTHLNSRANSSFDSSMDTDPRRMRSVASIASGSTGFSKSKKNLSKSSQESGSTLRVVGRGGSGSKLRVVGPQTEVITPVKVRLEHPPPLIRPSGRGGFASRPKPLNAPLVPPKDTTKSVDPEKPVFIRPSGRGGLASRPKPLGTSSSPTLFKLLHKNKNKNKIEKGKKKSPETTRAVHPLPPGHTYQISNASMTTLSTLHFVGETGEPSTPFFPDDRSINSNYGDGGASDMSDPLSGSSMYSSDHSSSKTTILSDSTAETTEEYCDENKPTTPIDHRQRNLNKLARTLGSCPDDAISSSQRPADDIQVTQTKKDRSAKVFRRASISVTSLTSMFGRSGGRSGRDSVATTTMTDDLHQFGLDDDLSDSWGTISANSICEPPASPIVFSPPSPAHEKDPNPNPVRGLGGDEANSESLYGGADSMSVASSTLSYNSSQQSGMRTRAFSHSHHHSSSASMLSDFQPESNKSIWLIPVKDDDDMDIRPHRKGTLVHRISDKPQNWSGEWNDDIHQVIKSLRLL